MDIDHIHNTGHLDDKRFSDDRQRNAYYVKHPIEAINNLQILCSNCNAIKEYERKKAMKKSDIPRNIKSREDYQKIKNSAFEILGSYICTQCKFKDHRALDIDHIYGKGRSDRNSFTRQNGFHKYIIENPKEAKKKLQIMCRNCNEIKKRMQNQE